MLFPQLFVVTVLLLVLSLTTALPQVSLPLTHRLPEIKFADLLSHDSDAAQNLIAYFTDLGAIQITGIPRFGMIRKRALEDLAECLEDEDTAPSIIMADGSKRVSTGAASHHGKAEKMTNACGLPSTQLRITVDTVTGLVFQTLDSKLPEDESDRDLLMQPSYDRFSDLIAYGEHLEHLHSYYSATSASKDEASSVATLDYHIDAGMMIAMTTGYYANTIPSPQSGLFIKLLDGSRVKVEADDDALILLMGEGASKWLTPVFGKPFRALPHAMIADLPVGSKGSRSWYGKMYLPPSDAIIPQTQGKTFETYHRIESEYSSTLNHVTKSTDQSKLQQLLPSACGGELGSRYLLTTAATCSGANQIWCWARCMDTSSLSCNIGNTTSAICWDSHANTISGGGHCMPGNYCFPVCPNVTMSPSTTPTFAPTATPTLMPSMSDNMHDMDTTNGDSSSYCYGSGTSMFMEGFVSIVSEGSGQTECVNLLFKQWTLNSQIKYGFACFGVFIMCFMIQWITKVRSSHVVIDTVLAMVFPDTKAGQYTVVGQGDVKKPQSSTPMYALWIKRVINTILFGIQITLSYFAMLIAMSYSVELFTMVCVGLTVGYGVFHSDNSRNQLSDPCCPEIADSEKSSADSDSGSNGSGGTGKGKVCCDGNTEGQYEMVNTNGEINAVPVAEEA